MASFNNTKGGDIEGQIKNNLAKPTKREELLIERLEDIAPKQTLLLDYITLHELPQLEESMDKLIEILNYERAYVEDINKGNEGLAILKNPLFEEALDEQGNVILAWSEKENSIVRIPHKTGDA